MRVIGLTLVVIAACSSPVGAEPAVGVSEVAPGLDLAACAPSGLALGGYDAVSYHSGRDPIPGRPDLVVIEEGLTYRFATEANRATFVSRPQAYLPKYRGWCSTNLALGRLSCPDFANFKIENGELLLFERVGFTNGRDVWDSDPLLHRRQADHYWQRFSESDRSE